MRLIYFGITLIILTSGCLNARSFSFTENKGQWPNYVLFQSPIRGANLYLERDRFTFDVKAYGSATGHHHQITSRQVVQMIFHHALPAISTQGYHRSSSYKNYFIGNNPLHWASKAFDYTKVVMSGIYPCTDIQVYTSEEEELKYDYIVSPGGDPSIFKWSYEGASSVILLNNTLYLRTINNEITESIPSCYQTINGNKINVPVCYVQNGKYFGFSFPGGYNPAYELIIDPKLVFSTYTGSISDNWGSSATYDSQKNAFGAGYTDGSGYPTTTGVYDSSFNGVGFESYNWDIAITKFIDDGMNIAYSTYLGGNGIDIPHSIIADSHDNLYLLGSTESFNFPVTPGCYDSSFNGGPYYTPEGGVYYANGADIIITRLSADGTQLLGATYLGGTDLDGLNSNDAAHLFYNYGDQARGEIILDEADNVYITSSTNSYDFPLVNAQQNSFGGLQDALLCKLTSNLNTLLFSTYIGDNDYDAGYSLKLDSNGNIFVCGGTSDNNSFPMPIGGLNSSFLGGQSDGFILKFSNDGANVLNGSFIGSSSYDQTYFIEVDKNDDVYVLGQSTGNYPVTAGAYSNNNSKQFIHKLNNDLSTTLISTRFGSNSSTPNISPTAFLVDECLRVYVAGWGGTNGVGFGVLNTDGMPVTPDAYDGITDGNDFYLAVFEQDLTGLIYASFFGENNGLVTDHVDGGTSRFDKRGAVYQAVCAGCGGSNNFPTTLNAWSQTNDALNCNMAVFKIDFELGFPEANPSLSPFLEIDSLEGCLDPITGVFGQFFYQYNLDPAEIDSTEFFWDFGVPGIDTDVSTLPSPIYIYTDTGSYNIRLIVRDTTKCIPTDTAFVVVEVRDADPLQAHFSYNQPNPCSGDYTIDFDLSLSLITGNEYSYAWDFFGTGMFLEVPNNQFDFGNPGTYPVSLLVRDSLPCFRTDTFTQVIVLSAEGDVEASFSDPPDGCIPHYISISALESLPGSSYVWDAGNGQQYSGLTADITYDEEGQYFLSLIVSHPSSCNGSDTLGYEIAAYDVPAAEFSYSPVNGLVGEPVSFISQISAVDAYLLQWSFGDGTFSSDSNPIHTYLQQSSFTVCLEVTNADGGCAAEICKDLTIEAFFGLEVPNAFSPNNDGINDVFMPLNFGLLEYRFTIFNRWGKAVFTTTDPQTGWDGRHNGVMQDIDVYVYHISATPAGGEKLEKKGNLSLLR